MGVTGVATALLLSLAVLANLCHAGALQAWQRDEARPVSPVAPPHHQNDLRRRVPQPPAPFEGLRDRRLRPTHPPNDRIIASLQLPARPGDAPRPRDRSNPGPQPNRGYPPTEHPSSPGLHPTPVPSGVFPPMKKHEVPSAPPSRVEDANVEDDPWKIYNQELTKVIERNAEKMKKYEAMKAEFYKNTSS